MSWTVMPWLKYFIAINTCNNATFLMISISNDNDFLWECAFVKQSDLGNDCNWIVPNKNDLNPFCDGNDSDNNVDDKQYVIRLYSNNTKQSNTTLQSCVVANGIRLNIQEIRDFGVMDIISESVSQSVGLDT